MRQFSVILIGYRRRLFPRLKLGAGGVGYVGRYVREQLVSSLLREVKIGHLLKKTGNLNSGQAFMGHKLILIVKKFTFLVYKPLSRFPLLRYCISRFYGLEISEHRIFATVPKRSAYSSPRSFLSSGNGLGKASWTRDSLECSDYSFHSKMLKEHLSICK